MSTDKLAHLHNDFPHIGQQHNWDCGLACVAMIMIGLDQRKATVAGEERWGTGGKLEFYRVLDKLQNDALHGFGCRPWTIDLYHILQELKVPCTHFTSHSPITVNEALSKLHYYASASFKQDTVRIADLVRMNPKLANNTTSTIPFMGNHTFRKLLEQGPLLVLADRNKLHCQRCLANNFVKHIIKKLFRRGNGFVGHYIVVVGWSNWSLSSGIDNTTTVYYRDPAVLHGLCATKLKHFNEARLAFGTDGDIIAIKI